MTKRKGSHKPKRGKIEIMGAILTLTQDEHLNEGRIAGSLGVGWDRIRKYISHLGALGYLQESNDRGTTVYKATAKGANMAARINYVLSELGEMKGAEE